MVGVYEMMLLTIIGRVVTCLLAILTFWAAVKVWLLAFHDMGSVASLVLAWGSLVLFAIGGLIIVGGYLAIKLKLVGRHGVKIEDIPERFP